MHHNWIHLSIDMQQMFAGDTPWHVPWMAKILPAIVEISGFRPERSIFTRFIPPFTADEMTGAWQAYYRKWENMTLSRLAPQLVNLVDDLHCFIPPAQIFDKATYSPWIDGRLHRHLSSRGVDTVALSGGETDVCVLATALGAIDLGYRVKLLSDAVCSGVDNTHDASLELLKDRFSVQLELIDTQSFLRSV